MYYTINLTRSVTQPPNHQSAAQTAADCRGSHSPILGKQVRPLFPEFCRGNCRGKCRNRGNSFYHAPLPPDLYKCGGRGAFAIRRAGREGRKDDGCHHLDECFHFRFPLTFHLVLDGGSGPAPPSEARHRRGRGCWFRRGRRRGRRPRRDS